MQFLFAEDVFDCLVNDGGFDGFFSLVPLVACVMFLSAAAGIVFVGMSLFSAPALPHHCRAAVAAVELPLEQIRFFGLRGSRGALVGGKARLDAIKQIFFDDDGAIVLNDGVFVDVDPGVAFACQNLVDRVYGKGSARDGAFASGVQRGRDGLRADAGIVLIKDELDDRRGVIVRDELAIFDAVSVWGGPDDVLLHDGLPQAALDVLGKVGGVILCHGFEQAFEDDSFGVVGDRLCRGDELHAALLQFRLVESTVVAASGEAVELPDDDEAERLFLRVEDHALEVGALVGAARYGAVDVLADDLKIVLFAEGMAIAELTFDGQFRLGVR